MVCRRRIGGYCARGDGPRLRRRARCSPRQSRSTTRPSCRLPRLRPEAPRRFLRQERSRPSRRSSGRAAQVPRAADRYPNSTPGLVAKYHPGGDPRGPRPVTPGERSSGFRKWSAKGTSSSIYALGTARLGLADAQVASGQVRQRDSDLHGAESRHHLLDAAWTDCADAARDALRPGRPARKKPHEHSTGSSRSSRNRATSRKRSGSSKPRGSPDVPVSPHAPDARSGWARRHAAETSP